MRKWIRTCQECGTAQTCPYPNLTDNPSDAFRNRKCIECGSSGLDYGSEKDVLILTGNKVVIPLKQGIEEGE